VIRQQAGALLGLVAVTMASGWLYLGTGSQAQAPGDGRRPEIYIESPQWDMLDPQGTLKQRLRAARMEQWKGEDSARLAEPELEIFQPQGAPWTVTANQGRIFSDERPVLLQEQVVLRRARPDGENETILKTARLLLDRSGETMETGAPVVLQSGNWHFRSVGLRAGFDGDRIELLDQVRGIHE